MSGYIVESSTLGILVSQEFGDLGRREGIVSRFSWSRPRSDAKRFVSVEGAQHAINLLKPRQRNHVSVLVFGTWETVINERGELIMPKEPPKRDEHGEHEDDQPGRPRPPQDQQKQAEHYASEADASEQNSNDN